MHLQQKAALFLCDFDGTISIKDVGKLVLKHFMLKSPAGSCAKCVPDDTGSRQAYLRIAPLMAAGRESLKSFVLKHSGIDPSFAGFYRLAKKKKVDVKIVSDGLDFYIRTIMEKHRLGEIESFSNRIAFGPGESLMFHFPELNHLCGRCGTCKNKILHEHRLLYDKIIYVGNGQSDVCPSRYADVVFAKDVLLKKCGEEGRTQYHPFKNFSTVTEYLKNNF